MITIINLENQNGLSIDEPELSMHTKFHAQATKSQTNSKNIRLFKDIQAENLINVPSLKKKEDVRTKYLYNPSQLPIFIPATIQERAQTIDCFRNIQNPKYQYKKNIQHCNIARNDDPGLVKFLVKRPINILNDKAQKKNGLMFICDLWDKKYFQTVLKVSEIDEQIKSIDISHRAALPDKMAKMHKIFSERHKEFYNLEKLDIPLKSNRNPFFKSKEDVNEECSEIAYDDLGVQENNLLNDTREDSKEINDCMIFDFVKRSTSEFDIFRAKSTDIDNLNLKQLSDLRIVKTDPNIPNSTGKSNHSEKISHIRKKKWNPFSIAKNENASPIVKNIQKTDKSDSWSKIVTPLPAKSSFAKYKKSNLANTYKLSSMPFTQSQNKYQINFSKLGQTNSHPYLQFKSEEKVQNNLEFMKIMENLLETCKNLKNTQEINQDLKNLQEFTQKKKYKRNYNNFNNKYQKILFIVELIIY